jgi:hypothetical protein
MALPQCPNCHAALLLAGNQRYCPSCGWNRQGAIAALRGNLRMIPLGILMFAGMAAFFIFRWHFRNPIQIAIFTVGPAFGILLQYILARRSLAKLEATPVSATRPAAAGAELTGGRSDSTDGNIEPTAEESAKYQALLRSSRPREVRMSSRGYFGIIAGSIFGVGMAVSFGLHSYSLWARSQSFARFHGSDWVVAMLGVLLMLVPFGMWSGQKKEVDLLENGEVTLGKVTRQWSNKDGSFIECNFTDWSGQTHKLLATDTTRKLYSGMAVPMFYDRENPRRALAYCATLHEVVI